MSILPYTTDRFGRVLPETENLPSDPAAFAQHLSQSIAQWQAEGHATVWLSLREDQAMLIPTAVSHGFTFHNTKGDRLTMVYSLVPDAFVLHFASHYIGAGGVVINEQNEILTIRQRPLRDNAPQGFKLPGGFIEEGEHLSDGVMREVKEETGIDTEFESVVCFRQWHLNRLGKSDIYFVCRLRPLSFDITPEDAEIAEACWMPVADFLIHDEVNIFNREVVRLALESEGLHSGWFDGYRPEPHWRQQIELFIPKTAT